VTNKDHNDNTLRKLKSLLEQLGYTVELLSKSEDLPVETLSLCLEQDAKNRPQFLMLTLYPLGDALDASHFVQFYFQYPFEIDVARRGKILQALPAVNQELPLGHFNLSADEKSVYFKYVFALPQNQDVEPLFFNDVLDMCLYAQTHFQDRFEVLV